MNDQDIATARVAIVALQHCRDQKAIRTRLEPLVERCESEAIRHTFAEQFA